MHDPAGSEIFAGGGGLEARAEPDQTTKGTIRIKPRDSGALDGDENET